MDRHWYNYGVDERGIILTVLAGCLMESISGTWMYGLFPFFLFSSKLIDSVSPFLTEASENIPSAFFLGCHLGRFIVINGRDQELFPLFKQLPIVKCSFQIRFPDKDLG